MASDPIVYVIDDDDGARGSLEFLLDCAEIRVRGFASADAFLKASPPLEGACVVTDVRMPGTSGIELVEARIDGRELVVVGSAAGKTESGDHRHAEHAGRSQMVGRNHDNPPSSMGHRNIAGFVRKP